jgi:hypothetical protein
MSNYVLRRNLNELHITNKQMKTTVKLTSSARNQWREDIWAAYSVGSFFLWRGRGLRIAWMGGLGADSRPAETDKLAAALQWQRHHHQISGGYGIHPSPGKAIECLSRHIKIAAAVSTKDDLTHQSNLSPEEGDAKILTLAKSGDKMGAVKLTRQIYGSTLSEAVAFVEKLQSGG